MTVANEKNRNAYVATAGQKVFAYDFRILNKEHISVYQNGSILTLTTQYTVSNVGVAGGGNVTLVTGATVNDTITIIRNVPLSQLVDYVENDAFPAQTHEDAIDQLTMAIQELDERMDRALLLTVESTLTGITMPDPVAGSAIRWNTGLTGFENFTGAGLGNVIGPSTSTDNAIPKFDGTTGQSLLDTGLIIDDSDNLSGVNNLTVGGTLGVTGLTTLAGLTATGNISFDGGTFTFNEAGADLDARWEGDTDANLWFLDASTDRIGIGTNTPGTKLHVAGTFKATGNVEHDGGTYIFNETGADVDARWESDNNSSKMFLDSGNDKFQIAMGTASTALANVGGVLHSDAVPTNSTGSGGTETLKTYTLPANSLSANSKGLRITFAFQTAANTNSKTINVKFGGTTCYTLTTTTSSLISLAEFVVMRSGASTQFAYSPTLGFDTDTGAIVVFAAPAEVETGTIEIKMDCLATGASGDVTASHFMVEALD